MLQLSAHEFLPALQMGERLHLSCGKAGKDGGESHEKRLVIVICLKGLQMSPLDPYFLSRTASGMKRKIDVKLIVRNADVPALTRSDAYD